ncbi:MAG: type II toxin-antitoxin system RelE/ParE family toxin [bacterium]|nr:type II toxin-antitoxin system RelE/ParE family toxin [bacterium]
MPKETKRKVSWVKAALKEFNNFPLTAREEIAYALALAADGRMPELVKPMKGLGSGVFEIALRHQGDAYRTIYAVQIGDDLWVVHAFKKKSTSGIKTPKHEIDLIRNRIKAIKEALG